MKHPQLSVDLAPHEQQLGKYRLVARLGQGGMGTVYLALASGLGSFRKLLVVKELRHDLPWRESSLSMFLDEAQLAARLDHPNVLQTFEAGEANGRYFLAMEYLDGQPLSALIDHTVPLELHVYILCEVLQGLQYAHELTDYDGSSLHVVHRDVSPQNVFVTHHGQVKIVDFGVAKANIGSNITSPGVFKGKFAYAAPEQLLGRPVDGRCDVFAVGVMLWEAIAKRRFGVPKPTVDAFRVRTQGLEPKISQIAPDVDPLLAEICDHALAVDPLQRVESAEALRARLQEWLLLQGEHIQAKQLSAFMQERFSEERVQRRRIIERAMVDAGASQSTIAALPRELLERESGMAPRVEAQTGSEPISSSGISPSPRAHAHQPQPMPQAQAAPLGHEFGQPVLGGPPALHAQPTQHPQHAEPHFAQATQQLGQPAQKPFGQPVQPGIPALPVHLQTPVQPGHPHEFGQPVQHAQTFGHGTQPPQLAAAQRRDDASQRMSAVSPSLAYAQEAMAGPSPRRERKPPSRLSSAVVLLSVAVGVFLVTYQLSRRATEPNNAPRLHPAQGARPTITTRSPATSLPNANEPAHDTHAVTGQPQPTAESAQPGDSSPRPHHGSSSESTRERSRHEGSARDSLSRDAVRDSLSRDARDSLTRDSRDSLSRDAARDSLSRDAARGESARDSLSRDAARDSRDSLSRGSARSSRDSLARDSHDSPSRDAARGETARDARDSLSRDSANRDTGRDSSPRHSARESVVGSGSPAAAIPTSSTATGVGADRGAQRGAPVPPPSAANISKLTVRDFNIVTEGDPASKGTRARTPAERTPAAAGKPRAGASSRGDTGMGTDLRQFRHNGPSRIDTEDPYQ